MLFTLVVSWVSSAASWLVSQFPGDAAPSGLAYTRGQAGSVWAFLAWANQYLPLDAVLGAAGVVMTIWAALWAVNALVWVLTKLHILGGS